MAAALLPIAIVVIALSAAAAAGDIIEQVCVVTADQSTCRSLLQQAGDRLPQNATVLQAIDAALWVSTRHLSKAQQMIGDVEATSAGNYNRSIAATTCSELLYFSMYRMNMTSRVVSRDGIKDARAWLSAVVNYEFACGVKLKPVSDTPPVIDAVAFFNSSLMPSSMNALAMVANYDFFGEKVGLWGPPKTERDGFWETGSELGQLGRVQGSLVAGFEVNATVCKGGECNYKNVQDAVGAAPCNSGSRFVIWIKAGVYEETVRVPLTKMNVVFLGDGMGKTVITGSLAVGPQVTTYNSATVGVHGDGFMASNITFHNTAGSDARQAVAFRSDSDHSVIENCEFIGNQDTLYANALRQYYKSCRIEGNIDFIFGNSASFFQDCLILVGPRQSKSGTGGANPVTAHSRIHPAQSLGFVFQNCTINGTDAYVALYHQNPDIHRSFLGRPWKEYARTIFIGCTIEALISPDGWIPWDGDFALNTLYFGEFDNTGPGSDTSKRVKWSSVIPSNHAHLYSLKNFIQGDQWIPTSSSNSI